MSTQHASAVGAMITVAISIADEAAKSLIEGECVRKPAPDGSEWWDTTLATQIHVERSYLRARGLLEQHKTMPHLVRFRTTA